MDPGPSVAEAPAPNPGLEASEREAYNVICENFRMLRRKYDALAKAHNELLWDPAVLDAAGLTKMLPRVDATLVESSQRVSEIELLKVIGRGNFSSVLLGQWPSKEKCAVKKISKSAARAIQDIRSIATEHEALTTLSRGPCVLALHCALATPQHIYFVMEFFGEELYKYLQRHKDDILPPVFGTSVIHGVANGLAFMHDLCFAHRDIKPENVLIHVTGDRFSDIIVKLCDLGLCAKLELSPLLDTKEEAKAESPKQPADETTTTRVERRRNSTGSPQHHQQGLPPTFSNVADRTFKPLFKCCGSMGFFAPDMLDPWGYSGAAVDVWSLGCLGLEIVAGNAFFESFWFDGNYTIFFKPGGRGASGENFRKWIEPSVASLTEFVATCADDTLLSETPEEEVPLPAYRRRYGSMSEPPSRKLFPATDAQFTRLRDHWQVLSIVTTCLRLDPTIRPQAFEIRDMLAAILPSTTVEKIVDVPSPAPPCDVVTPREERPAMVRQSSRSGGFSFGFRSWRRKVQRSFTVGRRHHDDGETIKATTPPRNGANSPFSRPRRVAPSDGLPDPSNDSDDLFDSRRSNDNPVDTFARALADFSNKRGKVLVVDDSSVALHWICKAIESKFNCDVHTASSAIEALSLTEHNDYDAVLTDMIMPHMDGFQLVTALRTREQKKRHRDPTGSHKRLFICALTQLAEAFDVKNSCDVDVVSRKPFGKNHIDLDFLSAYLERREPSVPE